ncbi:hypothetical protein [Rachiplusia nu nucleopolyhedrovirus]|uniref:Uncharacterized protein n=1 Tax=Rachiplusia nu nucleopolyhedrovirus TaxID=2605775 RepID=A0AAE6M6B3_9ABAC|nr:hypothetical protein QKQ55_gp009 [Rachiplusia nu nucleopolyhedrovirus]QEI03578.1 hypothetical protein [Rachiplusia nu nucleopolyhedrovirus]
MILSLSLPLVDFSFIFFGKFEFTRALATIAPDEDFEANFLIIVLRLIAQNTQLLMKILFRASTFIRRTFQRPGRLWYSLFLESIKLICFIYKLKHDPTINKFVFLEHNKDELVKNMIGMFRVVRELH